MLGIDRLIEEHQAMDDMASNLTQLVQSSEPRTVEAFVLLRQLAACLDEHLMDEEGFLYSDHVRAIPGKLEAEVHVFEQEFEDLKSEWTTYLHEWTPENIALDWRNFDHVTQWIMGRLRARIAQENDILYPLALHYGRIRLRSPSVPANATSGTAAANICRLFS